MPVPSPLVSPYSMQLNHFSAIQQKKTAWNFSRREL